MKQSVIYKNIRAKISQQILSDNILTVGKNDINGRPKWESTQITS